MNHLIYPRLLLLFSLLLLQLSTSSAWAQCAKKNLAFESEEVIHYQVSYNWKFVWVNAGEVTFSVAADNWADQPAYHITGKGKSYPFYDFIYKVRDTYEVWADTATLSPYYFERKTREGKQRVHNRYTFDQPAGKVYARLQSSDTIAWQDTLSWSDCTFDVLSLIYQARNFEYGSFAPGDTIPISALIDGVTYDNLYIRYLGEERFHNRDGRTYDCLKFKPLLVEGTIFSGGEDMTVWVTNDLNRLPVMVEAKILVGSVKAYLMEADGLRYPVEALVED